MAVRAYQPKEIEAKWIKEWEDKGVYKTPSAPKDKQYVLGMFPYPSGEGLHTGHGRIFTAVDVVSRYFRMKGRDVLMPVGWDAFGLPAENAAIKAKTNPMAMVPKNEANFKRQMQMLGLSFDWDRAFSTTDPEYYKWTQWIFLKLYGKKNEKGERLVYRKEVAINWCPKCKTGLANEEVEADGTHERCGTAVTQRMLPQWVMRITDYSDRLLDGLIWLDWPKGILEMQKNWIGRREGTRVKFKLVIPTGLSSQTGSVISTGAEPRRGPSGRSGEIPLDSERDPSTSLRSARDDNGVGMTGIVLDDRSEVEVFTTRLDTILGVTFIVISPELAKDWITKGFEASKEVLLYIDKSLAKSDQQRLEDVKEKTGVDTGVKAVNPVNGEEVPVYVADYVLSEVGTGAVMGVPFYDERDKAFAVKMGLPMGSGKLVDLEETLKELKEKGVARKEVNYHLRDWIFSRQRYWGEPIPILYCQNCARTQELPPSPKAPEGHSKNSRTQDGVFDVVEYEGQKCAVIPVPEGELPLKLPQLESYEPTDDGKSPLSRVEEFVKTKCPVCGGPATRETDTMPNWAGSCWYFLRFAKKLKNSRTQEFKTMEEEWRKDLLPEIEKWLPVDWYLGGAEHAVLHLLYARFWVKVLHDLGYLSFDEPFKKLRSVGMVLASDGKKMSKSLGNVINPDDVVEKFGADAVRIYEMFMGPWDQVNAWEERSLVGCRRFLDRVWSLVIPATSVISAKAEIHLHIDSRLRGNDNVREDDKLTRELDKLIEKVGKDIEEFKFNTAIAAMMKFSNSWQSSVSRGQGLMDQDIRRFLLILAPFAPFMSEELYQELKNSRSQELKTVHKEQWPHFASGYAGRGPDEEMDIVVQVNGKVRGIIQVKSIKSKDKSEIERLALNNERISKWVGGKTYKTVVVPGKLINFVLS